jgi:hypothetical protein
MMVYLNGPSRGVSRARLHDAPPGYRPPRRRLPLKDRKRKARRDWILMRFSSAILIPIAVALAVIIVLMIVTHA